MKVDIMVVGAGVAGFSAVEEFKQRAPGVSVLLVDAENRLPYKRTKLSKTLAEGFGRDAFALEPPSWYDPVAIRAGVAVTHIDPARHTATLADGTTVTWDQLLLATGARAVVPDLPRVREWSVLRNQDEAERLRGRWANEPEVVVLGNGVLGVEIAEQAQLVGKRVRLWGRRPPLHRELTPRASDLLSETLDRHGVLQESPVDEPLGWAVAAVGSSPDLSLARAAGLATERGVLVDSSLRTSVEGIWAAGDGTQLPNGAVCHLWHESEAQGRTAARSMLGEEVALSTRPWRLKSEVFGTYWFSMNKLEREPDLEREEGKRYQAFWFAADRLVAAVMANDKERNKVYETAVLEGWDPKRVADSLA